MHSIFLNLKRYLNLSLLVQIQQLDIGWILSEILSDVIHDQLHEVYTLQETWTSIEKNI